MFEGYSLAEAKQPLKINCGGDMYKIIALIMVLLVSTSKKEIEQIGVTGSTSEETILNAQKITFLNNGKIYLTDKIYCRVNVYNKNLKQISTYGKKGKQLGEFKAPSQITCNNKYIVISDFASSRVQVFDYNYKVLNQFFTEGPIFDLSFDKNGYLLVGVYTGKKEKALFKYSTKGEKVENISLKNTYGDPFKDIFKFTILPNGFVAITYFVQNVIEILDANYKYAKTIAIEKLPVHPEYKTLGKGLSVPIENLIQSIASDSKSRIFVLAAHYVKMPKQEVYVYSLEGKLLKTILLPAPTDEIFIDKENYFYTIEKNRTILKKYKIRV